MDSFTLHPHTAQAQTLPIYEVQAAKATHAHDWIAEYPPSDNPLPGQGHWGQVWDHLQGGPGQAPPRYDLALQCLAQHLKECPDDPCGRWLTEAIQGRSEASGPPPVLMAGGLPFVSHYGVPRGGPAAGAAPPSCWAQAEPWMVDGLMWSVPAAEQ